MIPPRFLIFPFEHHTQNLQACSGCTKLMAARTDYLATINLVSGRKLVEFANRGRTASGFSFAYSYN